MWCSDCWRRTVLQSFRVIFWDWSVMLFLSERGVPNWTQCCTILNPCHEDCFSLVQKMDLPSPIRDGGDFIPCHLWLMAWHFIINFEYFKFPKTIYACLGSVFQLWGSLYVILTLYWISPFQTFTSKKGTIFLRFPRYFEGVNDMS